MITVCFPNFKGDFLLHAIYYTVFVPKLWKRDESFFIKGIMCLPRMQFPPLFDNVGKGYSNANNNKFNKYPWKLPVALFNISVIIPVLIKFNVIKV